MSDRDRCMVSEKETVAGEGTEEVLVGEIRELGRVRNHRGLLDGQDQIQTVYTSIQLVLLLPLCVCVCVCVCVLT